MLILFIYFYLFYFFVFTNLQQEHIVPIIIVYNCYLSDCTNIVPTIKMDMCKKSLSSICDMLSDSEPHSNVELKWWLVNENNL